ncbi:uncharacterized protein LOC143851030 isoform X2 [Tasmannia lanceolata]|uniref:uncharacterized protein LOC143851030 isoform X2 n=1 Tax=Tasmannia lanceolata TaxID=3420 RepID=UPI0040646A10
MEEEEGDSIDGLRNTISGRIDLCTEKTIPDLTGQIHQLPCCIKHDGPSDVSHCLFLLLGFIVEGFEVEEASFRGRKLQGASIPLPEGYCGLMPSSRASKS